MADGSIHIDTHLDDSGLKSGIEKMKCTVSSGFSALGSLAVKGLAAATAATATFVVAATKAGIEFESAFAGVKKTVDATDEELEQLRTGILDMSKEIPLAATEIAGIAEAAGQLGIKTENLLGFTEVMANLGVSTNMSADEAATALARLANITQMPQDQFDRLGSTVVALGNNFATTESEIVDMALRLAGTGSQVGLSEAQILSFSAALSSVGLEAELGGSAFSRVFKMMQLATETEGEALEAFAAVAGMSASEFKRAFEEDAASAMIAFVAGLGNAEQHGMTAIGILENMSEVEGLNALSTVAVSDALLRAAGSSEVMAEALQVGSQAWEENTALTNEASQRYETLESKIQLLKNTATAFMITMSDSWRGTCAEFVSAGTQMITALDTAFQSGGINGLIEALGPALEQAVTLILSYVPRFMEVAVQLLSGLAQGILNNLPLLTQAAVQVITQLVTGFVNAFPQILSTGAQILSILVQGIIEAAPTIFDAAVDLIDDFQKGLASKLPDVMAKAGELIQRFAAKISEKLPVIIESGIQVINNFTRGLADNIPAVVKSISQIVSSITNTLCDALPEILDIGIELVEKLITGILDNGDGLIESGLQLIVKLTQGIVGAIPRLLEALPNIIESIISFLGRNAPQFIEAGIQIIISLVAGIIQAIPKIVAAIPQVAKAIVEGLWEGIKSLASWLKERVTGFFDDVVGWVKGVFGIHSPSTVFAGIGGNIVDGTYKGIENKRSSFTSKVKNFFGGIVDSVKSTLGIHSPSALFRDVIGKNIGLGVKVGIEDTQPKVSKAMNSLVDPEKATSRVSRMKSSVSDHVSSMTRSASAGASKVIVSGSPDYPSPDAIAEAIWDKAPPMEVDLDGEKVGSMIEPNVSKIQAKKTESMNRRNGIVTA